MWNKINHGPPLRPDLDFGCIVRLTPNQQRDDLACTKQQKSTIHMRARGSRSFVEEPLKTFEI